MADRQVTVRLKADIDQYIREISTAERATRALRGEAERFDGRTFRAKFDVDTRSASRNLRNTNVDVRTLASAVTALGPGAIAAAGVAGGALLGLSGSIGVVAAAAGTSIAAFQGIGDAVKAMREYELDPTAKNLDKMRLAMAQLTTEGQQFARYVDSLRPALRDLRNVAQAGMLPGVETGLREVMTLMPQVESLVGETSRVLGDLAAESGRAFNTAGVREYLSYLESRARPVLDALVRSTMAVGAGVAGVLRGFDAAFGNDVLRGMESITAQFAQWGTNLRLSSALYEFGDYVRQVGPQVAQTLGALARAVLAVAEAAAPIGPAALVAIEGIANAVGLIASSGAGPVLVGVAAGLGAINLALKGAQAVRGSALATTLAGVAASGGRASGAAGALSGALSRLGPAALVVGVAAVGIGAAYDTIKSKAQANAEAVARGSMTTRQAFDDELRRLRDRKQVLADMEGPGYAAGQAIGEMTGKIDLNAQALAEEREAMRLTQEGRQQYLAGLPPAERATAALAIAQNDYSDAVQRFGEYSPQAVFAKDAVANAARGVESAERLAASATQTATERMREQSDVFLGARDAELAYANAKAASTDAIARNGATTDINTQAGRDNRGALDAMAQAALRDIEAKAKHGASTDDITRRTSEHASQLYRTMIQMGASKDEAARYVQQLGLVPPDQTTRFLTPGLKEAIDGVNEFNRKINEILRNGPVQAGVNVGRALSFGARATGGPIHGPGTGTSDSIPTLLSDGEFVHRAAVVREQGQGRMALLNAGMADIVPRRATGGPVSREATVDFRQLASFVRNKTNEAFPPMPEGGMMLGNGDAGQLGNARIIAQVARAMGFGRNGLVVALATALQESGLRNLNYGDRDSVGLFQQRTSQGWGSIAQIMNPGYSASKFFQGLRGVRGWERMPVTVAAQRVQRSAFPNAYAKWVGMANSLASQVGFRDGGRIPGTGGGDNKMLLAQSGERVLTRPQNVAFERMVSVLDKPMPISGIAGSVRGGDGAALRPVINQEIHNVIHEQVDADLVASQLDFKLRTATF